MSLNTVEDIERAIVTLKPQELAKLYEWLDQYQHPFDTQIQSDFVVGRLDDMMTAAVAEDQAGRTRSL